MKPPKATPEGIRRAERDSRVLAMRRMGATYEQIAAALGFETRSGPCRVVRKYLRDLPMEDKVSLRKMEMLRLDELAAPFYRIAMDGSKETGERLACAAFVASVSRDRRRLLGLDAPIEIDVTTLTAEERFAKAQALYDSVMSIEAKFEREDEE